MELTEEALDGWYANPVTQYILQLIADESIEKRATPKYRAGDSAEKIALECAHTEGCIEGSLSLLSMHKGLKFILQHQKEEQQEDDKNTETNN